MDTVKLLRFAPWLPLCALTPAALFSAPASSPARLDRFNLMEYRAADGKVQPVRSVPDWRVRRAEILAGMQAIMGPFPGPEKRVNLDVRVESEKDFGRFVRRHITYTSEPGSRTPALLFLPRMVLEGGGSAPRPGVLCLMGTGGHKHRDIEPGPNIGGNVQDGEALAERGLAAIAPAYPTLGFGSRSGLNVPYNPDLRALGYASGTMKAVWDNIRALDVLASLPYVKKSGFGTIGHSLGGHNSIYTAVFDERIQVIVSSCGFDSFLDYLPRLWKPGQGWAQERYMPRIIDYPREEIPFDFHELAGALAPRAFFVNAPVNDSNFHWQSVARIVAAARPVYQLFEVPGLLRVVHPNAAHDFPPDIREAAYDWIEQFL